MKYFAAVVIPVYKSLLNAYEKMALKQCLKVLERYSIILVAPKGLDISNYDGNFDKVVTFSGEYFESKRTYSHLMTSRLFYAEFFDYDYILIYQLDAFVFDDQLSYWCEKGYSYIGGPWGHVRTYDVGKHIPLVPSDTFKIKVQVGNGGFSLRNVRDCYRVLWFYEKVFSSRLFDEDVFWSIAGKLFPGFKSSTLEEAAYFSLDENPREIYELFGSKKPFGCHAWMKYDNDFWCSLFQEQGFEIKEMISSINSQNTSQS